MMFQPLRKRLILPPLLFAGICYGPVQNPAQLTGATILFGFLMALYACGWVLTGIGRVRLLQLLGLLAIAWMLYQWAIGNMQ